MIAALHDRPATPETQPAQDASANPLRRGEWVRCPACDTEGLAWQWEMRRSPNYKAWTAPVYHCRTPKCNFIFAVPE